MITSDCTASRTVNTGCWVLMSVSVIEKVW